MIGQKSSLIFTIFSNPLIWIGAVLAILHLRTTPTDVWQVFEETETYRNLLIGSAIWTLIFDRHYTKNREQIAIADNIFAIIVNAYIIFFVWGIIVFAVTEYHQSGLEYSYTLRKRLAEEQTMRASDQTSSAAIPTSLNLEQGKRYKLTPSDDGSFILEILDK